MEQLWNDDLFVDENTLSVNVNRLRKKLDEAGLTDFIKTKKGQGYIIEWSSFLYKVPSSRYVYLHGITYLRVGAVLAVRTAGNSCRKPYLSFSGAVPYMRDRWFYQIQSKA